MRAVVGRVEQQHNRDRHQCNRSDKDAQHRLCVIPVRCSRRCALVYLNVGGANEEAPGEIISGGFLDRRDWVHPPIQRC
jgi:hypothetical protein